MPAVGIRTKAFQYPQHAKGRTVDSFRPARPAPVGTDICPSRALNLCAMRSACLARFGETVDAADELCQ